MRKPRLRRPPEADAPAPAPADAGAEGDGAARPAAAEAGAGQPAPAAEAGPPADPGADQELAARRAELGRIEERLRAKEQSLDSALADLEARREALELTADELERRQESLDDRARNLDVEAGRLKDLKRAQLHELERVAGLSAAQAKQILLAELEDEVRREGARLVRAVEGEARTEADRRARSILAACMQRVAGGHAVETTVTTVELRSDDLKGRIIGREGRNIRSLEALTGVDFIIDDTPNAVLLSSFDGVRREVARLTLERLLQDGRVHPSRIEEAYEAARASVEDEIVRAGEEAALDAGVGALHPELTKLLGRLKFRTSYSQNVLAHSVECANLAGLLAAELGANPKTAARAALLHDVGKAVSHEAQGSHALVGGRLARRYREPEAVAHAMEAHHDEVDTQTIEAVIVQIVDRLSGARPGARGESLEHYVSRLRDLEEVAARRPGVEKVYAMHAGREVRVVVKPEEIGDDEATMLSHEIARDVERELDYPGQVKITVIRESRSTDYAQ